jgi:2-aminoadipate transaminase
MATQKSATRSVRSRLAERTRAYGESSIWKELLDLMSKHPDPIYFGDGSPAREAMPVEYMREGYARALDDGPQVLGYGESSGFQPLREFIASSMQARGINADAESIQVTNGSSQGIELITRIMIDPGDVIVIEHPTFLGALEIFETYQARMIGVPVDEHGMDIDALERVLIAEPRVKMIYTIPTFQNPSGTTLPLDRRQRMVELANAHGVVIVEDDPYWELQYDGEVIPPIRSLDDGVVHLGTFSKTIAPGIRTGWIVTPPALRRTLLSAREVIDLNNDRMTMRMVYHTAHAHQAEYLDTARGIYRSRRDAMLAALERELGAIPDTSWSKPEGGFFVWVTLPEKANGNTFMYEAAEAGVVFFPGAWFYVDHSKTNVLRLSFSTVPEARIDEGIQRLGASLRAHLGQ